MEPRILGRRAYPEVEAAMRAYTAARTGESADELWLVEHEPVYTLGVAGRLEHLRDAGSIPVVRTGRGGQVTYHGPGQVVAYPLVDLRRRGYHVKEYVHRLEQALIDTLEAFGITGHRVRSAPGVYVRLADPGGHPVLAAPAPGADPFEGLGKIAALGLKVSNHRSYHGVALNVAMDLEPYARIDPCGHARLQTVDLRRLGVDADWTDVARTLARKLQVRLS